MSSEYMRLIIAEYIEEYTLLHQYLPNAKEIEKEVGCSNRTVYEVIKDLIAIGKLETDQNPFIDISHIRIPTLEIRRKSKCQVQKQVEETWNSQTNEKKN